MAFVTNGNAGLESSNNYGTEFCVVSVIPTCIDDSFWNALGWKERVQIFRKKREADIRLRIDYDRFMRETPENRRLLFVDIIIKSIQHVQDRSKGDFKGRELITDILNALNITSRQLNNI